MDGSLAHRHAAVLIVGSGFAGASTAFHLKRVGVSDVVVVERESDGVAHSSGRNAAMIRRHTGDAEVDRFTTRGADALRTLQLVPFRTCGGFLLGPDQGDDDLSELVPTLRGWGTYEPRDGTVDPGALLAAYLRGANVEYGCDVLEIEPQPDGALVHTSRGTWQADIVVNAAGAWAGRVGGLEVSPTNRHVYRTRLPAGIPTNAPYVWDEQRGYYLRPENTTLLTSPCDETPARPGAYIENPNALRELSETLAKAQPDLGALEIRSTWVGQRTFARDRRPILGFDAERPRLYHVAALGGHGVTLSYAVGEHAAGEIAAALAPTTS